METDVSSGLVLALL